MVVNVCFVMGQCGSHAFDKRAQSLVPRKKVIRQMHYSLVYFALIWVIVV